MPRLTFWFEFASTYSYLTAMRIDAAAAAAGVETAWRPFLLGPIFADQGWRNSPFNIYRDKGVNMWRDLERRAAARGLPPIARPPMFPQNSLLAARVATLALNAGGGAAEAPWGRDFVRAVYAAQFARGEAIDTPEAVAALLDGLGVDGAAVAAEAGQAPEIKAALRAAGEEARGHGIFGAPSFTTEDGELFWGDDRLEDALEWAAGRAVRP